MRNKQKDKLRSKNDFGGYARFSGMAFQMLGTILGGTLLGVQADKYIDIEFPVFTILGVVLSVILAVYFAIKDLI